jgi:hypothetical protein
VQCEQIGGFYVVGMRLAEEHFMKIGKSILLVLVGSALGAVGCAGGRDVEVSGVVSGPEGVSVGETLVIDFIDTLPEGSKGETPTTHRRVLHGLGEFKETVSLESDQVGLWGLDDRNGDGYCSEGEAWGRVSSAPIVNDRAQGITLMLLVQPCPPLNE